MVTLGIGLMLFEVANRAAAVTGGVDGLGGVRMWKVLGLFEFDLQGRTAYGYCLVVVFAVFVVIRRLVNSPFGLSLRGIREGPRRMPAIGTPVVRRLTAVYTLAACVAGIAGALLAQTTQFVGINTLSFSRSAEALIMVVLGGPGTLYGAMIGATVFIAARDYLASLNPVYWEFWLGVLLIFVVFARRFGILNRLLSKVRA
jgi:branched-chain amino acid transport system permease protein